MDNQQYRELMYHFKYLESMLEVIADKVDSTKNGGGGSVPFAAKVFMYIFLLVKV